MVKNSKILVAGGTGFIGTNLILDLISKGNEVISLSNGTIKKHTLKGVYYIYHDLTKPLKKNEIKIGVRMIFQSNQKTLSDEEINKNTKKILEPILKIDGVSIPGM